MKASDASMTAKTIKQRHISRHLLHRALDLVIR